MENNKENPKNRENFMEEKKVRTFEEIMEGFDRIEKMQEENAKKMAENMKGFAELRELQKKNEEESAKRQEESAKRLAELEKFIKEIGKNVDGMNKSAGLIAEEQVLDFLTRTMTFGGNHYDAIQQNVHSKRTINDGEKIEAEYDVLLTNDVSVCIIETKSRAREDDIKDLVENKATKFKKLFPIFANHKLYLGFAAMSFEKGVREEAKKLGIGILKPKGDFVEVYDDNLKVY
jgi:hypothetical protein